MQEGKCLGEVKSVFLNPEIVSASPVRFEKCMFLLFIICFLSFKKATISFSYIHPGYLIPTSNPQVKMLSLSDEL